MPQIEMIFYIMQPCFELVTLGNNLIHRPFQNLFLKITYKIKRALLIQSCHNANAMHTG